MMNWIWLGAVVAFGVLEAATAALVSIWFVGGAAVALLAVRRCGFRLPCFWRPPWVFWRQSGP